MNEYFFGGLVLTSLILFVGHWFPWPYRLPRLAAYVYGTAAIMTGMSLWFLGLRLYYLIAGMWAFAVVGGITTGLAWGYDWFMNWRVRQRIGDGSHK